MDDYFYKFDRARGYCKIFQRVKQSNGKWKQIYCRSLGRAENHHKMLLRMESNERAREDLKKSLVTKELDQ